MSDLGIEEQKEILIQEAVELLAQGRGHIGIINLIRRKGESAENAKRLSYPIFDEAKRRLRKQQIPVIFSGWFLIIGFLILPTILFFSDVGFAVYMYAPIFAGAIILAKVQNPERLPEP